MNTLIKKILLASFVCFFALTVVTYAEEGVGVAPVWQKENNVDLTAFRYVTQPITTIIEVPTVVEVPVDGTLFEKKVAVVEGNDGELLPTYYKTYTTDPKERLIAEISSYTGYSAIASAVVDGNSSTSITIPFSSTENNIYTCTLRAVSGAPMTSSAITIQLAPNVALPDTVSVRAIQDGEGVVVLVAKRPLESHVIQFPETIARTFIVEFEVSQPLRIAELSLAQKTEAIKSDVVRFLAQPDMSYVIYVDPDRAYGSVNTGGVMLSNNKDVKTLDPARFERNQQYVLADTDRDGIPDVNDNCPKTENADQTDKDRNGTGDACDDFDRDGIMTLQDNCPNTPNHDQRDTDGDGEGDVCDKNEDRFTERNPWIPWVGMGIAATTLLGLLVMSVRMKPVGTTQTGELQPQRKEDEVAQEHDESQVTPQV